MSVNEHFGMIKHKNSMISSFQPASHVTNIQVTHARQQMNQTIKFVYRILQGLGVAQAAVSESWP